MKTRIFIVEDETFIAMLLKDRLTHLGYTVCGVVAHGEAAIDLIEKAKPDVLIMNIKLAGEATGIDVGHRLRESSDIPVIYLSAYSDDELLDQAMATDPSGYLVKPFDERELHATIQAALTKHRSESELKTEIAELESRVHGNKGDLSVDDVQDRLWQLFPQFSALSDDERKALLKTTNARVIRGEPRELIIRSGVPVRYISFLISGWTVRYAVLEDGQRQVLAFNVPGSCLCVHALYGEHLPFSVQTLTQTIRLDLEIKPFLEAIWGDPRFAMAFFPFVCSDLAAIEDTMIDLGRRTAAEKISRLILKLYSRIKSAGLSETMAFDFPLRQRHIADATGLTPVHVNRILQQLRAQKMISLAKGRVEILDIEKLMSLADMTPDDI